MGLSASVIAARLGGFTRNAIVGKADRLGLPGRAPSGRTGPRRATTAAAKPARPPRVANGKVAVDAPCLPLPLAAATDIPTVATIDLEPHHCRWAIGDPAVVGHAAPLFCGADRALGSPYCDVHTRRAQGAPTIRPPRPRPPSKAAVLEMLRTVMEASAS